MPGRCEGPLLPPVSRRGQVCGNSASRLLLHLNGARFGFLHLRQRHREHAVLELSPGLVLIDATRKAEAPGIGADVVFRSTPAGVAWIALHNLGPSLPGCRSWRHPGYTVKVVMAVQAALRLTLFSAMAVSFLSAAFSSSRFCCSKVAQSLRPSSFAQAIKLP
jgi:hypothetical protein